MKKLSVFTFLLILLFQFTGAQIPGKNWSKIAGSEDENFLKSSEAKRIAGNVLLYQKNNGGWGKNIEIHQALSEVEKQKLINSKNDFSGTTIDNNATVQELIFLTSMYRVQSDEKYRKAFVDGIQYLLNAQYENGGWPQFYPIQANYSSHITYNDNAMANVLFLFQKIINDNKFYPIKLDDSTLKKIKISFDKGIVMILKTQYKQNGKLTVWCAQHDEFSLFPAKARAYELPSLSGKESVTLVLLLMSLENPSNEIIRSVESAVKWFQENKIEGFKEVRIDGDKRLVKDDRASPIWARFSDLETNEPFFSDRDGIRKKTYAEIGFERRNGYAWYVDDASEVLKKFPDWKKKYIKTINDKNYYTVSKDGSGDFLSIQNAIDHCKSFPDQRITIFVKNGIYNEKVKLHQWNSNLKIKGESRDKTIITFADYFNKIDIGRNSTFYTSTFLVEANDVILENLTIENTSGEVGQAIALSITSNRVAILDCKILGNQDTLYLGNEGKVYFKSCYIDGTTDYVFGSATAFFDQCELFSKKNSFITAPSTSKGSEFGFVFNQCKLTADSSVTKVYLGRPWRNFAKSVFINCELNKSIASEGWDNWNKKEAEQTSLFSEYMSFGDGSNAKSRVSWSKQLKKKDAKKYTKENVLKDEINKNWFENL